MLKKKIPAVRWQGGLLIALTRPQQALLIPITKLTLILRIWNIIRICTLSVCDVISSAFVFLRLRM